MNTFRPLSLIVLLLTAAIPDVAQVGMTHIKDIPGVDYRIVDVLTRISQLPWRATLFGLVFAMGRAVTAPPTRHIGISGIFEFLLLCPFLQFVISVLMVVPSAALAKAHLNGAILIGTIYAVTIGWIAVEALLLSLTPPVFLLLALWGFTTSLLPVISHTLPGVGQYFALAPYFFYTGIGLILGWCAATEED